MTRQQLNPWRTAGSGRGVVEMSDSLPQQRSRKHLDGRRPRRRSTTANMRIPALFVLLLAVTLLLLLSAPTCHAGKDKVVSTEPTTLLPPPVAAPALVPIPSADDYNNDDNDDTITNGDDPAQGPGGQGGGGPNGSGGGPGGAPTDDAATGGDDKGVVVVGTTTTAAPTSAPVAASGGSSGGGTSTTTTYSVSLPVMGLDLVLATTASSNAGEGSARRQLLQVGQRQEHVRHHERSLANGTTTTGAANSVNADVVDAALEDFLQTFLERSHRDTLQRVQLSTTVDSYQPATGVAHVTASDGTATFQGEQVQQTDLADTIATYLSFWGVQDLITAMHDHAGLNVLALNVTLDGVPVQPQVQVVNTGDGTTTTSNGGSNTGGGEGAGGGSGTSGSSSSSSESKSKDNSTLIVVIAVLGTLAVLLLAGTLWIVLKRRNSRAQLQVNKRLGGGMDSLDGDDRRVYGDDDDTQSFSPRPSSGRGSPSRFRILGTASAGSKSNLSTPNASPSRLSRAMSDDFRSLSGVVSVEESIFTSADAGGGTGTGRSVGGDVVVVRETSACSNSYLQYDPSRLDHVISSARGMAGPQQQKQQQKGIDPEANLSA
jgi:hypothetical protein